MTTTMVMATTLGEGDTVGKAGGRWERRRDLMGLFFSFVRESRCVCVCLSRACFTSSPTVGMLRGLMGPLCVSEWMDGAWIRSAVDGWINR
jgi:hypothetical protein